MTASDWSAMRAVLVGEPGGPTEDIVACEAAIRAAQLAADTAALDRLIAEDLLFTGPDGRHVPLYANLGPGRRWIVARRGRTRQSAACGLSTSCRVEIRFHA